MLQSLQAFDRLHESRDGILERDNQAMIRHIRATISGGGSTSSGSMSFGEIDISDSIPSAVIGPPYLASYGLQPTHCLTVSLCLPDVD
jgi:hypothetical protein